MCVFQFATQHRFLLIDVWGGEYEAHASATSVCISFQGSHGFWRYSHSCHCYCSNLWHDGLLWNEAKDSPWARDQENILFVSMHCDHRAPIQDWTYFIIRQQRIPRVSKYNLWKRGGKKISLFLQCTLSPLSSMLWRFLQANDHRIFFGELCTLSFHAFSSELWCNASKWLAGDGREDLACCTVFVSPANPRILICMFWLSVIFVHYWPCTERAKVVKSHLPCHWWMYVSWPQQTTRGQSVCETTTQQFQHVSIRGNDKLHMFVCFVFFYIISQKCRNKTIKVAV